MKKVAAGIVIVLLVLVGRYLWAQESVSETSPAVKPPEPISAADIVFYGGDILSMAGRTPGYLEAVAVKNGKISFTGSREDTLALAGDSTEIVDLKGRTLIPGFIDSHSHFILTGLKLATVNLDPPPAGTVQSIDEIIARLRERLANGQYDDNNWLFGWGYDTAMLAEGRHPTRADLDQASVDVPIAVIHFSTHMVAVNSKALALLKIDAATIAPEGGVIRREPGSDKPNGVLEEQAIHPVFSRLIGVAQGDAIIPLLDRSLDEYKSKGFTTALEFGAQPHDIEALQDYAASGRLDIDLAAAVLAVTQDADKTSALYSREYNNRFRVAGGKINIDGGTPGRTAYLRDPYYTQEEGGAADYRGYSSIENQEDLNALVESFYENTTPIFIHALGDAAIDQAITAVASAESKFPRDDIRTQLIHLQVFQPDQMDSLRELDVTLTFQNTHNFYFADFHNDHTLGPERTAKLIPMKSALDKGFSVTFHHDSPVHPVDSLDLIWIAVNRSSRSGKVYGPEERLTPYEALYASTHEAAYQMFEADRKGSLEVGKLADMVILSDNPLKVDPATIRDIEVLATFKEGENVYQRDEN
jgi:predicted amidohydrolase YtcJ